MPGEVPLRKKLFPTLGRGLWYVCGAILLLSLPTFSYLVPTLQGPYQGQPAGDSGFVSRDASLDGFQAGEGGDRFVRSRAGSFYSRGRFTGVSKDLPRRSRTIRANRSSSRSQRGLDRLSQKRRTRAASTQAKPVAKGEDESVTKEAQEPTPRAARELSQMEQVYQNTFNNLFPTQSSPYGRGNINPFQSALNPQGGGGSGGDPPADDGSGDEGSSDEGDGSDDGTGTDGDGSGGGSDTEDEGDDGEETPRIYDFLVIGQIAGEQSTVFRAYRDGTAGFVVESGSQIRFFPSSGVVGIPQNSFSLTEDQLIVAADFSGDGREDFVVAGWEYPASFIRGYVQRGQPYSEPDFEVVIQFVKVESVTVYDFDSDGSPELAIAFTDNPNLVVYKIDANGIRYSRELVVPFEPSMLVGTQDQGIFKRRFLQVFDRTASRSISFSSLFPGVYSFSQPASFQRSSRVVLDPTEGQSVGEEFLILRYDDVMAVAEVLPDRVSFLTCFPYSGGYPKVAIGRDPEDGSRQLIFVP